jgi:hypothetical protein
MTHFYIYGVCVHIHGYAYVILCMHKCMGSTTVVYGLDPLAYWLAS